MLQSPVLTDMKYGKFCTLNHYHPNPRRSENMTQNFKQIVSYNMIIMTRISPLFTTSK